MNDDVISQRIAALAQAASIEISPREIDELPRAAAYLRPATIVTITWMPKDRYADRVAAARAVRKAGFEPVPHIAARRIGAESEVRDFLAQLREEADVRRVFVVGGDVKRPLGPFDSAFALIEAGVLQESGIQSVGVAGYPEAHPVISGAALNEAYHRKRAILSRTGADAFVVTQFCFDAVAIQSLLRRRAAEADAAPIRIGLAGPANFATLVRFAARCGVVTSARAFATHGDAVMKLLGEASPEPIVRAVAAMPDFERLPPLALHVFPFGGFARTSAWLGEFVARRGQSIIR